MTQPSPESLFSMHIQVTVVGAGESTCFYFPFYCAICFECDEGE
jgi:hypothetical protein